MVFQAGAFGLFFLVPPLVLFGVPELFGEVAVDVVLVVVAVT